jgi:hypothetical protein
MQVKSSVVKEPSGFLHDIRKSYNTMEITYSVLSLWYEYIAKVPGFSSGLRGSNGAHVPELSEWQGDDGECNGRENVYP